MTPRGTLTPRGTQTSIKITFKNNTLTKQRTLIISEHNPLKRLHQFHHRNKFNLLILPCILIMCCFKAL